MNLVFKSLSKWNMEEWSLLGSMVSPSFFKVLSPLDLASVVRRGVQASKSPPPQFAASLEKLKTYLECHPSHTGHTGHTSHTKSSGEAALFVFFTQVLSTSFHHLDLRRESFSKNGKGSVWEPAKLRFLFSEEFTTGVRHVYSGFFKSDNEKYSRGLQVLGLPGFEEVFASHFGSAQSQNVTFSSKVFVESFHAVFTGCKTRGIKIPAEFAAFGIMLSTLYLHLESLEQNTKTGFPVHDIFLKAEAAFV